MTLQAFIAGVITSCLVVTALLPGAHAHDVSMPSHHGDQTPVRAAAPALPPLPSDVSELAFTDIFKMPVGPVGLEPTQTLLSLRGKRVRLAGFMVRAEEPVPGLFMLTPVPVSLAEHADGPADDLPANTVFVHMPRDDGHAVLPYKPGLWTLMGTLDLGAKEEVDGRVSYVRLMLDKDAGSKHDMAARAD